MTQQQIFCIAIALLAIVLVLGFVKKALKVFLTVAIIVGALIYFGLVTPSQVKDVGNMIKENAQIKTQITQLTKASKNIKLNIEKDGVVVKVKIDGDWISTDDIKNIVSISDNSCTLTIKGKEYTIKDKAVVDLMELLKK